MKTGTACKDSMDEAQPRPNLCLCIYLSRLCLSAYWRINRDSLISLPRSETLRGLSVS